MMTSTFYRRSTPPWLVSPSLTRWPYRLTWSRILEGYQRDLEQRAADVAGAVQRLRQPPTAPSRAYRQGIPEAGGRNAKVVELPQSGRMLVHEIDGPPGAATLVLLHGWRGTAAGNWATAMASLGREFRVIAPNLRDHGDGAVDDVVALADALGVGRFIAVGYSLGSSVAFRLWQRHPDRVAGLVLCAAAGVNPPASRTPDAEEVPVAVVVTRQDRLVPAWRQLDLARSLPGATVHAVNGNHFAFRQRRLFVPVLLAACHSVAERADENTTNV
jgi:pimeloyl-ACP methyl ester carboxylesterase